MDVFAPNANYEGGGESIPTWKRFKRVAQASGVSCAKPNK